MSQLVSPFTDRNDGYPYLTPEKALTPLGQIVRETPGFLPTFSTDEPKVITRWGWEGGGGGVFKQLRA